jgi:hypothetical protein
VFSLALVGLFSLGVFINVVKEVKRVKGLRAVIELNALKELS